ncbi:MAG: PID-CTERM protein-sorting domain-containing protein [Bacteroidota bacterium]|jgi:hypothetical protein
MKIMHYYLSGILLLLLLSATEALAGPPPPPPPTPVPIDGGLSLVIAGCVGYGAKKIYDKKKK